MRDYTVIKFSDLPPVVQAAARDHRFKGAQAQLTVCERFEDTGSWNDYDLRTMIAVNASTGESKAITSGNYECFMNWSAEELAMYNGKLSVDMKPDMWILIVGTYPKRCEVYCHPINMAKKLTAPPPELTRREQICLFITNSIISSYRLTEARDFGFTRAEWDACNSRLMALKLMTRGKALTIAGKNAASGLNFNSWEERDANSAT